MWKVYTETHKDFEGFKKYETLCAANVVNSGYIKMDYFMIIIVIRMSSL